METPHTWTAIAIHPDDDVAVALGPCGPGEIRVRIGGETKVVALRQSVALGHKIALRDIGTGATVRKYGEVIGEASTAIGRGEHVHVHNLKSRRARAEASAPRRNAKNGRKP